ncbi:MarR family winged helix-turn-helix transcriptional regulator [soil metagenome]
MADVARLMRRSFDERARGIGVTRPQWRVLSVLSRHEGINQGRLADMLEVEPITLCRMVDRLQDAGLIERRRHATDRRAWCLHLTDRALDLIGELRPLAEELLDSALDGISADDRGALERALDQMRRNLARETGQKVPIHG